MLVVQPRFNVDAPRRPAGGFYLLVLPSVFSVIAACDTWHWTRAVIQFHLQVDSPIPPYEQIVAQVIFAIASGRLEIGSLLPSVREVGPQILVHPNTVAKPYQEVERLGVIVARRGNGVASTARAL